MFCCCCCSNSLTANATTCTSWSISPTLLAGGGGGGSGRGDGDGGRGRRGVKGREVCVFCPLTSSFPFRGQAKPALSWLQLTKAARSPLVVMDGVTAHCDAVQSKPRSHLPRRSVWDQSLRRESAPCALTTAPPRVQCSRVTCFLFCLCGTA